MHATVDGIDTVVYLSLTTDEKNDRRDHCWRCAPPSHAIIDKGVKVEIGRPVNGLNVEDDE
jgi:hypothetical protein